MRIEVRGLSFSYGRRPVLQDIHFAVDRGEFLSILGPNGVGKSTLFRCVLGLQPGYTGQVLVEGRDSRHFSAREAARHIAYIPQNCSPAFRYSVFDMVLMGATGGLRAFSAPGPRDCDRAMWALDKMGISHLADRCFHRISGGERQLAMIARALVQDAPILMLDEPTASLDFGNQLLVLRHVRALAQEGYTVIQTTHNPEQSYLFSHRILALRDGRVLTVGTPKEVLTEDTMRELYQVDVHISSLCGDGVRVCIPRDVAGDP